MHILNYFYILAVTHFIRVGMLSFYWVAGDFRAKARHIVYNYLLYHNIYTNGLEQYRSTGHTYLNNSNGYVAYEDVSKLKYLFWHWAVWIWLDDHADNDTFSVDWINTSSWSKMSKEIIGKRLLADAVRSTVRGSAFKLGDARAVFPSEGFISEIRHLSMCRSNYEYKSHYTTDLKDVFYKRIFGYEFGWKFKEKYRNQDVYELVMLKRY